MWNPITEIKKMVNAIRMVWTAVMVVKEAQKVSKQLEVMKEFSMEETDNGAK